MLLTILGCGGGDTKDDVAIEPPAESEGARVEAVSGPVRVTVELVPAAPRFSDQPTLTITLDYQRGVTVEKPAFGEAIGDFVILGIDQPLPEVRGDREIARQVVRLEPQRTGTLTVLPIAVHFTDDRPDGDGARHSLQTDALEVEVASVLEGETPSLADLRPPSDPVELPTSYRPLVWWALGGAAVLCAIAAGLGVWWIGRRRRHEVVVELSPHEWAHRQLDELHQSRLAETDVKAFFVALTDVVRRFIERTTGVHAPEQTTEEFLHAIGTHPEFGDDRRGRLRHFLEAADLVKFAAHQPEPHDIERSLETARAFIGAEVREEAAA